MIFKDLLQGHACLFGLKIRVLTDFETVTDQVTQPVTLMAYGNLGEFQAPDIWDPFPTATIGLLQVESIHLGSDPCGSWWIDTGVISIHSSRQGDVIAFCALVPFPFLPEELDIKAWERNIPIFSVLYSIAHHLVDPPWLIGLSVAGVRPLHFSLGSGRFMETMLSHVPPDKPCQEPAYRRHT